MVAQLAADGRLIREAVVTPHLVGDAADDAVGAILVEPVGRVDEVAGGGLHILLGEDGQAAQDLGHERGVGLGEGDGHGALVTCHAVHVGAHRTAEGVAEGAGVGGGHLQRIDHVVCLQLVPAMEAGIGPDGNLQHRAALLDLGQVPGQLRHRSHLVIEAVERVVEEVHQQLLGGIERVRRQQARRMVAGQHHQRVVVGLARLDRRRRLRGDGGHGRLGRLQRGGRRRCGVFETGADEEGRRRREEG